MVKLFYLRTLTKKFTKDIKAFDTENYNTVIIYFNWVDKKISISNTLFRRQLFKYRQCI